MNADEANKLLDQAVHGLGEHFGSVVILATYPSDSMPGLTQMARRGAGDWFAQQGMLAEEMQRTAQVSLACEIARHQREAGSE